ncbi:MAG: serine/threonine-protein kinase [Kofleriaceae bacterium]
MTDVGLGGRTDPLVGTVLDKDYFTVQRIGVGGMSVVYLVEHQRLNKQMAAKLLNAELAANPEASRRFETEAKSASSLEHENIVRVSDYGLASDGRPYIIMELLRGRTLDEQLLEQTLSLEESVLVIVSVCRGLAAAHADNIIHRDIKPDNIYLTQRANGTFGVKILDFGIAKAPLLTGRQTKHGQTIGTPHYMAPEACRGEEVDNRADIYSVGVLMYLLFTGQLPHHDDNFLALLQKQVTEVVTPPSQLNPHITPALEQVIMTAIAKDPDDRYLSVEHLLSEFELALPDGANMLLLSAARVSTPIPMITPTSVPALRTPTGQRPPLRPSQPPPIASPTLSPPPDLKKKSKLPLILIAALLLVGGGIAAMAMGGKKDDSGTKVADTQPVAQPTPPPAQPRKVGQQAVDSNDIANAPPTVSKVKLKVVTKPRAAMVKLDGAELGRTPLDLEVAPQDMAKLEIVADGYDKESRQLALLSDQTLEVTLNRKQSSGGGSTTTNRTPKVPQQQQTKGSGSQPAGSAAGDSDLDIRMHR